MGIIDNISDLNNNKTDSSNESNILLQRLCNIDLLNEVEKFTKIAILGGLIAFLSLTYDKKDLINESDSINKVYCLDTISSTLGIIVTFYFFMLSIKTYRFDETNNVLINSQKLNIITSFILFIIEVLRFIDTFKVNNLRYLNNDNIVLEEDIIPEISVI